MAFNIHMLDLVHKCKIIYKTFSDVFGEYFPISTQIDNYSNMSVHEFNMLTLMDVKSSLMILFNEYFTYVLNEKSKDVVDNYLEMIKNKKYCSQGGHGHLISVYFKGQQSSTPSNWIVKPEFYNELVVTPKIKFALFCNGLHVVVSEKSSDH